MSTVLIPRAPQMESYEPAYPVVLGGELYAGTVDGALLKWNGTDAWVEVAPALAEHPSVNGIAAFNGTIYASSSGASLLEWDGVSSWDLVATTPAGATNLFPLLVFDSELYGGGFGVGDGRLYKWNGADAWVEVAGSINGENTLKALAIFNSAIWAFTSNNGYLAELVGGSLVQRADEYDTDTASPPQRGGLVVLNGNIYGTDTNNEFSLKRWDGATSWETVVEHVSGRAGSLWVHDGEIYSFDTSAGLRPLVKWNGLSLPDGEWVEVATPSGFNLVNGISFAGKHYVLGSGGLYEVHQLTTPPSGAKSERPRRGDVRLYFDGQTTDIRVREGDLERDDGLETAILISLFTDRRVAPEEIPGPDKSYLGGCWMDDLPTPIEGSRLWLLWQSNINNETLTKARAYVEEALAWLIREKVVSSFDIEVLRLGLDALQINISGVRKTGGNFQYSLNWGNQLNAI